MAALSEAHKQKMAEGRKRAREERLAARAAAPQSEVQEELAAQPKPEVLGTITESNWKPNANIWTSANGDVIDLREMPPWLQDMTKGSQRRGSLDARTFVDYPADWVTRWQHPSRIQTDGYRDWLPMMASHPAVKVKVRQMVDAGNNIRMGLNGPILTFMPQAWWEQKQAMKRRDMLRRTVGEVDKKLDAFTEDVARGKYGRHVKPYDSTHRGSFPRNPTFDGRAVREADPT